MNIYKKNKEILEKTHYFNNVNFSSFQRKTKNTLNWERLMRTLGCLSIIFHQKNITIGLMTRKTTTNTSKNQKFRRKVREEKAEAILTIRFSLKILSKLHWTFPISQWEQTFLGYCDMISKGTKITKGIQKLKKKLWKPVASKSWYQ